MLAFKIDVDGEPFVTAGVEDWSMLTFSVVAGRRVAGRDETDDLHLHLGGLAGGGELHDRDHVRWTPPEAAVGKRLTLTVVETDEVDPPVRRFSGDPSAFLRATVNQRQDRYDYYLALKAEFEPEAD